MPSGLRKIRIVVDGTGMTRFGGLVLFQQFCKSMGLRRFLQKRVQWPPYDDRKFHPADLFLTHLYAKVAGLGRVESLKNLKLNGLLPALLGLPELPHRDTLRSFLSRFSGSGLHQLQSAHLRLRQRLFEPLGLTWSAVLDLDTTAITVYGNQEGSSLGYNPGHYGKRCYSALLASEHRSGLSLGLDLRSGRDHPTTGALPMLRQSLDQLPSTVALTRTRLRADASFMDPDIVQFLDEKRIGYTIVTRSTAPIRHRVSGLKFRDFRSHWAAAEFSYTFWRWKQPHRLIVIRHDLGTEAPRTSLFRMQNFDYRVAVTNLDMTPEAVWRFYCDRANQELLIREIKTAFAASQIPARRFLANAVHLEIALWAYDLVLAFKQLCLPEAFTNWNVSTLRRDLWCLPGQWVRTENRNVLRLPASFDHPEIIRSIQQRLSALKPLI